MITKTYAETERRPAQEVTGSGDAREIELSVVMPCLNEAETLTICIKKAQRSMRELGLAGEVVITDNGSTDGSQEIARRAGARVMDVEAKAYGNALMGGISARRGKYVIMGDADDSYRATRRSCHVRACLNGSDHIYPGRRASRLASAPLENVN